MNRLNLLTLGTKDIMRAHRFYKEIGFDTSVVGPEENPAILFFKNDGTRIALFPLDELAKDINRENPPTVSAGFPGITLAYNAKSLDEMHNVFERVKAAGASIVKEPEPTDWGGHSGYFQDLDGYFWEVAYGEDWEFDECNMLIV